MPFFDAARIFVPSQKDVNLWADYVERLCIFSNGRISRDEIIDHLSDDGAKLMVDVNKVLRFDHGFLQPLRGENNEVEDDDAENLATERVNGNLITLYRFLKQRSILYGDKYPFSIDENLDVLNVIKERSPIQDAYLILLLSSDLRLYSPSDINKLGHCFEAFCKSPFEMTFSLQTTIKFFGAGAGEILPRDYHGNLKNRIKALCNDLKFTYNTLIDDPDEIPNVGDAGLDWVGWVSFPDEINHQPVFLGQCACGNDWIDKQHETSQSIWRNYMVFNQPITCIHMLPRSFRRTDGKWFKETQIQDVVLLDRLRLLHLLSLQKEYVQHKEYSALLQEAFEFDIT